MHWLGLMCAALGALMLATTAFGERTDSAAGSPVIGGILVVVGLLLLVGGGRRD